MDHGVQRGQSLDWKVRRAVPRLESEKSSLIQIHPEIIRIVMLCGRLYVTQGQKIPVKEYCLPKVATLKQISVRLQWTPLQLTYVFTWPLSDVR